MLKIGTYGLLRFNLPIAPDASQALSGVMIALSLIAIVYVGVVALSQVDMKRLIAYSSVAHMGFVTFGYFVIYAIVRHTGNVQDAAIALEGAMLQMVAHGVSSAALFFGFGMLYMRTHTRLIEKFGGVAHVMPAFAAFFLIFCLSNVGLPGTAGFVGEFMVLMGALKASFWLGLTAGLTLVISASYTLWMYRRVFYGTVANDAVRVLKDITPAERLLCCLLVGALFFLGVYPKPLLVMYHASTGHFLALSLQTKLGV